MSKKQRHHQQMPPQLVQPMMAKPSANVSNSSGQIVLSEPDQSKRWRTIYPQYINANLTVDKGRRLAKSKCVSDPLAEEIFNVLAASPQQFEVQLNMHKCYCREVDKENIHMRGYVKYRILQDDKKQYKNKRQLLVFIASMIPKLKSRQNPKPNTSGQGQAGGQQQHSEHTSNKQSGGKKKNRKK